MSTVPVNGPVTGRVLGPMGADARACNRSFNCFDHGGRTESTGGTGMCFVFGSIQNQLFVCVSICLSSLNVVCRNIFDSKKKCARFIRLQLSRILELTIETKSSITDLKAGQNDLRSGQEDFARRLAQLESRPFGAMAGPNRRDRAPSVSPPSLKPIARMFCHFSPHILFSTSLLSFSPIASCFSAVGRYFSSSV